MMGPNGPKEFKHDTARLIRYLFLPTKISKDPEIWRKYYDFLQFLKGKMIDNHKGKKDRSKKQIFQSYVDEHWVLRALSMEDSYGVDPEDIPQLKETYKKILRAMDSDLNEFIDILSEDLETFIMLGYSFLPEQRFYGGFVFRVLFDLIPEKFLDDYLGNFDESGKLQPPTKEGTEYIEKIE